MGICSINFFIVPKRFLNEESKEKIKQRNYFFVEKDKRVLLSTGFVQHLFLFVDLFILDFFLPIISYHAKMLGYNIKTRQASLLSWSLLSKKVQVLI